MIPPRFVTYQDSAAVYCYPLVGVHRHYEALCKPGLYRVVFSMDMQWYEDHFNAVIDDFGNLVRVP